jgi:outer membrane protein assembly factor BamB
MRPAIVLCAILGAATLVAAGDWMQFRGPDGTGIATGPTLPSQWTPDDYAWETLLPGIGHSSPVVYGGRLFVTAANDDGTSRQLHCLDTASGKILWTRTLSLQTDKLHAKNSYASGTTVLSDELVIVPFADDERFVVAAFRHDGTPVWDADLGPFESQHGHGASPILWRDLVIVPNDQDGNSSIVALDCRTGEIAWTASRTSGDTSYSTPFVLEVDGKPPQLIASCNALGVTSLDPATGTLNWSSGKLPQRTVGSPVFCDGVIVQTCGQGGRGTLLVGVDPFAGRDEERVVFTLDKSLPYVPTPIAYEGHLYLWNDNGVVVCLDAESHEPVWMERIGGKFSASPICVNGNLYSVDEDGEVVVLRAAPTFELLGRSSLGDEIYSTPAYADGKLFFHSFHKVVCLASSAEE